MLAKGKMGLPRVCAEGIVISFYESAAAGTRASATITMELESSSRSGAWRPILRLHPEITMPTLICQSIGKSGGNSHGSGSSSSRDSKNSGAFSSLEALVLGLHQTADNRSASSSQYVSGKHRVFHMAQVSAGIESLNVSRIPIQSPEQIPDILAVCSEWWKLPIFLELFV